MKDVGGIESAILDCELASNTARGGTGVARRDLQRGAEEAGSDPDDAARSPEITRCIVVANRR